MVSWATTSGVDEGIDCLSWMLSSLGAWLTASVLLSIGDPQVRQNLESRVIFDPQLLQKVLAKKCNKIINQKYS